MGGAVDAMGNHSDGKWPPGVLVCPSKAGNVWDAHAP